MSDTADDPLFGLTGDDRILREAKDRFGQCEDRESSARDHFKMDMKFANGDAYNNWQWPDGMVQDRAGRPSLTCNKVRQHCLQVINDARQNKAQVTVRPVGNGATFEAAQIFEGIVRHIEYISNAQAAYDAASWNQVIGGWGCWRIVTDYANDDTEDQEIYIRRIGDPLSVYVDPDCKEYDCSDARFAFIYEDMPRDVFRKRYPRFYDDALRTVPLDASSGAVFERGDRWDDDSHVRVCEYYRKTVTTERRKRSRDNRLVAMDEGDTGKPVRETERIKIEWFLIAGGRIVDRKLWAGNYIPIVCIKGEEWDVDGVLDRRGHVRSLIDAQRMYNYWSPLSLDTRLPTPTGWTTMGAVQAGDWLLDENGAPVRVAGTSPIHINRDCYAITFDDGSTIVADSAHKWTVEERGKRRGPTWDWQTKTVSTSELAPNKHFIWATKPLDLPDADLPVDPYVLGAWLGDGHSAAPRITAGAADVEEMRRIIAERGYKVGAPSFYNGKTAADFSVYGLVPTFSALGILGNKHVPAQYLRASREQRIALLQGLMDTDGSIDRKGQCSFTTVNAALSEGFAELVRSLGIKAVCCRRAAKARMFPSGNTYQCQEALQYSFTAGVDFPLFRLSRKAVGQKFDRKTHERRTKRHRIKSIVPVASVPVRCVAIDSASHLFLAGEAMVPTHNSAAVEYVALQTKAPFIGPAAAFENQPNWNNANTKNYPYLTFNHIDEDGNAIPPPQREQPPQMPGAYIEGLKVAAEELRMASGQYQAEMGAPSNERSGRAIEMRQRQGDNATYHFIEHFAQGLRFCGRILIDLIPKIYDTPRVMKILAEDGTQRTVAVDPTAPQGFQRAADPRTGAPLPQPGEDGFDPAAVASIFNPSIGTFAVIADVGPAYETRRQQAFDAMTEIIQRNPALTAVVGDLMFKSADFPLADEIAERLKRMVPPQALGTGPDQATQQLQAQLQQAQHAVVALQSQLQQAQAQAAQAKAAAATATAMAAQQSAQHMLASGEQDRDWYEAETKRIAAMGAVDPDALKPIIRQMVAEVIGPHAMAAIGAHKLHDQHIDAMTDAMTEHMKPVEPATSPTVQ